MAKFLLIASAVVAVSAKTVTPCNTTVVTTPCAIEAQQPCREMIAVEECCEEKKSGCTSSNSCCSASCTSSKDDCCSSSCSTKNCCESNSDNCDSDSACCNCCGDVSESCDSYDPLMICDADKPCEKAKKKFHKHCIKPCAEQGARTCEMLENIPCEQRALCDPQYPQREVEAGFVACNPKKTCKRRYFRGNMAPRVVYSDCQQNPHFQNLVAAFGNDSESD